MQLAQLGITNTVLAFSMYSKLSESKIEAINKIRTGTEVVLKDVNKRAPQLRQTMQRPIMISAVVAPFIHEGQLQIEVNETELADAPRVLAALLNAAVKAIQVMSDVPKPPIELHAEEEVVIVELENKPKDDNDRSP